MLVNSKSVQLVAKVCVVSLGGYGGLLSIWKIVGLLHFHDLSAGAFDDG